MPFIFSMENLMGHVILFAVRNVCVGVGEDWKQFLEFATIFDLCFHSVPKET